MPTNPYSAAFLDQRNALAPGLDEEDLLTPLVPPVPVAPLPQAPAPMAPAVPAGYGPGADAAAMADAEAQRGAADQSAMLLEAARLFNRAGGGSAGDLAAPARAGRDQGVQDVLRRRAMEDQDLQKAKQSRAAALEAALASAGSPETMKAREAFGGTSVGQRMRQRMGEEAWAKLTGNMLPGAKEQLSSEIEAMKLEGKNAPDPKFDAKSPLSVGAVDRAKAVLGQYDPPLLAKLGNSIDGMTFNEVTEQIYPLMTAEAKARWGKEIAGIQAGNRKDAQQAQTDNRFELKVAERQVGGFHPRKGVIPSDFQARELSKLAAATDTTTAALDTLRKGFERHGPEFFFGKARAIGLPTLEDARLRAKELYNLGVLNGQDYAIVSRIIPDPNTLRAAAFPKDFLTQMATVDRILKRALSRTAGRYNYEPDAPAPAPASPAPQAAPPVSTQAAVTEPETSPDGKYVNVDGEWYEREQE